MKKYISIIVVLSLFVIGCSEQASINTSVNNVSTNEPNWIALPAPQGMSVNTMYTATKEINGSTGGTIKMSESYLASNNRRVSISASLKFQKNAFDGTKLVTMTLDNIFGQAKFSPAGAFYKPALYNVTFMGLDLTGVNPSNVDFVYLNNDGTIEQIQYESLEVIISQGCLRVCNAYLPHFSRYGFVN